MQARELALRAAYAMDQKGGEEIRVLQVDEPGKLFEYVVLANGRSDRQCHTLTTAVWRLCKAQKIPHGAIEGERGWYVVDCHDVVIHALTKELRGYYLLEKLWPVQAELNWQAEHAKLTPLPEERRTRTRTPGTRSVTASTDANDSDDDLADDQA